MAEIRERFNARRGSAGRVEQAIRRMLGIDLKMKQYAQGSRFVRTVVREAGMAVFNRVWTSPETLPTTDELDDPRAVAGAGRGRGRRPLRRRQRLTGAGRRWARLRRWRRSAVRSGGAWRSSPPGDLVLAACSGGADSLALAAALAHEGPRSGLRAGGVTVDHGLQPGSRGGGREVAAAF